jgi:hypothetical protein
MKILPLSYINILMKDNGACRKHGIDKFNFSQPRTLKARNHV